ncbi:GNAT family N-acetyltransferase [Bacillus sp. DX1.1]|uniref:GNAT family N-acetyltransferase n=1 Tax=unclassified Bacillus (in: firmicutes) TaxID=185979 RepID=UPI002570E7D8|nr:MULTISPECIES: GNAT family N-acetyltransferase [unclassified Bacillus (in: firmicutes)]MDM5156296.1 GNAT family N-acetyltransferase [Bacillus sp. DX1.1]WJE80571.1 GNAT family N-acetyltransferase [Bacillus sp. DX3.1]
MIQVQKITVEMREVISHFMCENWGSTLMVSRGQAHHLEQLPGFVAIVNNRIIGIITYKIKNNYCEIVSLDSLDEKKGIGTKLVENVIEVARERLCKKIWLITTNDNTNALRFYQKRGFVMTNLYVDAVRAARLIKPEIPFVGYDDIEILHEIQLDLKICKVNR